MISQNLELLPYLRPQVTILWMECCEMPFEGIDIIQAESLPAERTDTG